MSWIARLAAGWADFGREPRTFTVREPSIIVRVGEHLGRGLPEAERAVPDGRHRGAHAPAVTVAVVDFGATPEGEAVLDALRSLPDLMGRKKVGPAEIDTGLLAGELQLGGLEGIGAFSPGAIHHDGVRAIEEYLPHRAAAVPDTGHVFTTVNGRPLEPQSLIRIVRAVAAIHPDLENLAPALSADAVTHSPATGHHLTEFLLALSAYEASRHGP